MIKEEHELESPKRDRASSLEYKTLNTLREMGYSREVSLYAINSTNSFNVETLLNFISKGFNTWEHEYERDLDTCLICKEPLDVHIHFKNSFSSAALHEESLQQVTFSSFSNHSIEVNPVIIGSLCEICLFDIEDPFNLSSCPAHLYCKKCLIQYIETLISEGKVERIKCPKLTCLTIFSENEIQELVSKESFSKYLKFKQRKVIEKDQRVKHCYQPDCEGLVRNENNQKKQSCSLCGSLLCFDCGLPWHKNKKCQVVIDKGYEKWASGKEVQACPGCKFKIEKIDGCNHITCAGCGHQWCWLCRGVYSYSHFESLNPFGCPSMQSGSIMRTRWTCCRIWCKRLIVCLIWIFGILLSPLLLIFGPAMFFIWANHTYKGFDLRKKCEAIIFVIAVILLIAFCVIVDLIVLGYYCHRSIKRCCQRLSYRRREFYLI